MTAIIIIRKIKNASHHDDFQVQAYLGHLIDVNEFVFLLSLSSSFFSLSSFSTSSSGFYSCLFVSMVASSDDLIDGDLCAVQKWQWKYRSLPRYLTTWIVIQRKRIQTRPFEDLIWIFSFFLTRRSRRCLEDNWCFQLNDLTLFTIHFRYEDTS